MVVSKNAYLTLEEMQENASYIWNDLSTKGWTMNSVAGMLGNMETESTINPGIWQGLNEGNMTGGFGLVQWTPASKYTDWADLQGYAWEDINGQLARLQYEIDNNIQWIETSTYPLSFQEFKVSTESPEYLADAFLINYERPADQTQPNRATQARYWYDYLAGENPPNDCDFIYPTIKNVTSGFRTPERPDHHGVDFADGNVHDIKASADGEVTRSEISPTYGEVIYILHLINGQEYETVYAHMQTGSRTVSVGDIVFQGEVIGVMGNTGESDGLHLHFEVHLGRWNDAKSNAIDPLTVLCDNPQPPTNQFDLIPLLLSDALNGWKY